MAIEKIQAQIIAEVDDQSFKQAWDKAKLFARDTKKELDKSFLFKLQLDKAQTKIQLDSARKLLSQAKKDWDKALTLKYTLKTNELQSKLTEAGRSLNNFKNTWEVWVSRLSRLFQSLWVDIWWLITKLWALAISVWLLKMWTNAIFLWDKLEQANISFSTMLWSADKAKVLLNDLAVFASTTPFELIWLRDTAKQLLAYWIESEKIIPTLKSLWDVSAWLSVPIERIALAYWQVKVAWKLMGQDLLQFTSAWVPLIAELAKNMGIAESEVKSLWSAWKISFKDVEKAFETMSWEWGKFFNLMEKQSETLSWQWSNLKDTADLLSEKLWTALIPALKKGIEFINNIIDVTIRYSKQIWFLLLALWTLIWAKWLLWLFTMLTRLIPIIKWSAIVTWLLSTSINLSTFSMRAFTIAAAPMLWMLVAITTALWGAKAAYDAYSSALELIDATSTMQKSQNTLIKMQDKAVNSRKDAISELKKQNEELTKSDSENSKKQIDINNKKIEANKKFLLAQYKLNVWEAWPKDSQAQIKTLWREWFLLMKEAEEQQKILDGATKVSTQTLNWLNSELSDMKDALWDLWVWTDAFKDLQKQIAESEKFIKWFTITSTWSTKKIEDKSKEAKKAEIEREKKWYKWLESKEEDRIEKIEERAKKIEKWKDIIKDYYSTVRDELDNSQDRLDDFDDKIEDSQKKLKWLREDLAWEKRETWVWLAERRIELEKELAELQIESRKWNLSWTEFEWMIALQKELETLKQNSNLISEENKTEASESETERLIRELGEKTIKINEEIKLEEKRLADFKTSKDQEQEIYKWIDDYRTTLEHNFTEVVKLEVEKRISELEKMRVKAIETANALAKAWITSSSTSVENNTTVNLQGSWFSSIDAQNIGNALTQKIDLSFKWIN